MGFLSDHMSNKMEMDEVLRTPIYDNPDHKHYGPVRRLHLILLYLFGSDLPEMERRFKEGFAMDWTEAMSSQLSDGRSEAPAAREIVRDLLVG